MTNYDPRKIESKWRKIWEKNKTFQVDLKKAKKPYYNLMMFPYPSAEGLHVGNVYAFTGSDIHGRFQRMKGFDVFEPIGFDAFGIHSENFAIKKGIHPKVLIKKNIAHFLQQLKNLGCLFDWRHEVDTTKPEYYKWTQWIFLQLFKAGLAYRKKAPVDWCPSCKTVLADEQVIQGKCERCGSEVIQKETEQWFFRITKYAEKLLKNLEKINWSERTKLAQKNWIGKSEGVTLRFKIKSMKLYFEMFDSVPQTFMAQTFTVIAPDHPLVYTLVEGTDYEKPVMEFVDKIKKKKVANRFDLEKEPEGIFTGRYLEYTPTGKQIPIWVASFAIYGYGTGIVNCSVHDERDFAFAKKYDIPLHPVMFPEDRELAEKVKNLEICYHHVPEGILQEPNEFKNRRWGEAREDIIHYIEKKNYGKKQAQYHLRDWLISRQRYWGPPIPIIYCKKCGAVPVPEKDLPVLLPYVKNFRPEGTGQSPLASVKSFINTKCPKCKGPAGRETDVSDTFLDSAWYYLRYPSVGIDNKPFDTTLTKKWLPVDTYIGGQEHAVLHLLYSRFIAMALKDLGLIDFEEPFKKFRAHGLLKKEGAKMSKSKGNVVNPDEYYQKYGADTLRMYLMFLGPFTQGGDWQDNGIIGITRFLNKIWGLKSQITNSKSQTNPKFQTLLHQTIKKVTEDLENLQYNTAISALMILANEMVKQPALEIRNLELVIKLLSPFAPYISEELWSQLGNKDSIHNQPWPEYDEKLIKEETITLIAQVNGRVRDKIEVNADISEEEAKKLTLSREKVKQWVSDKEIKKVIFIKNKLINIVV